MKTKVLIVDDEPVVRDILQRKLGNLGFNAFTACDGVEGLDMAIRERPDLILLDVMMPNKDGFAMLKDLQSNEVTRRISVIMATAKGNTSDIYYGQDLGATDYLIKPIEFESLLKVIRKYTDSGQS